MEKQACKKNITPPPPQRFGCCVFQQTVYVNLPISNSLNFITEMQDEYSFLS
jgi:hypothetical protein